MLTDQWKFFLYEKSNIDRRKVHDSDSSKFPIQSLSSFPWKYFGCYANSIIAEIVWWELNISHFDPYVRPTGTVPHKNKKEKNVNICAWSQVKYATKMDFQPDTGQEYSIQVFLNALWLLWKCSEKNLEVGECVGRLMILFNGLRPSFPHFATPANKNSEISEFFRDFRKFSDSGTLKSIQSVSFQLLLWSF